MPFHPKLTRRQFTIATSAFLSFPLAKFARAAEADSGPAAESAYIWGMPLVLTNRYRGLATRYSENQFTLSTRLSTPDDKVAGPNTDTLWLRISGFDRRAADSACARHQ